MAGNVIISTLQADTWKDTAGVNEFYKCRAWVNFNGTGTVAIRGSGNVSSITDNGVGNYTVNLTNAMPDNNFSVVASGNKDATSKALQIGTLVASTTTADVYTGTDTSTLSDWQQVSAVIFR